MGTFRTNPDSSGSATICRGPGRTLSGYVRFRARIVFIYYIYRTLRSVSASSERNLFTPPVCGRSIERDFLCETRHPTPRETLYLFVPFVGLVYSVTLLIRRGFFLRPGCSSGENINPAPSRHKFFKFIIARSRI